MLFEAPLEILRRLRDLQAAVAQTRAAEHVYNPRGAAFDVQERTGPEVLICGPSGTGKSRAALEKMHRAALDHPGMRGLICRKVRDSLGSTGLVTWERHVIAEDMAAGTVSFYGGSAAKAAQYRYRNGSTVTIGGLDKAIKIMSSEYDLIFCQEAIELTEDDWQALTTRLRNGVMPFQQLLADANPDRPTHWLKQRCDQGRTVMLHSRHEDNPVLFDDAGQVTPAGAAYIAKLDALTGVRLDRLRYGRWVAAEGLVYEMFDPALHIIDAVIGDDWPRYWSTDFGYCVDEATEILTESGWRRYDQVQIGQQCLSVSPATGLAEWDDILDVSVFPAQRRDMIAMDSLSHSSLTTPNHRWLCSYDRNDPSKLRFKTTDSFTSNDMVPTAAPVVNLPSEPKLTDALVELVAWYWTEGSRWKSGVGNSRGTHTGGSIAQNLGPHADRIKAALTRMYGPPSVSMREGKTKNRTPKWRDWTRRSNARPGDERGTFHLNGPALAPILEWVDGPDKVVRPEFFLVLTQAQLDLFIQVSLDADGYVASVKSGTLGITQSHLGRLESFQMACQLAGRATVLRHHARGKYQWHSLTIFTKYRQFMPSRLRRAEVYEGRIWCPTTRNGTWLARRNGTVYFTGNTNPFTLQCWAEDPDGRLILYRELYRTQRLVEDHARDILAIVAPHGEWLEPQPRAIVCDHDAEDRATLERHLGMSTVPARKSISDGIQAVAQRLRPAGDSRPRLLFGRSALVAPDPELVDSKKPTCLVEELPGYVWDRPPATAAGDARPAKEIPLKRDDHSADAMRYLVAHVDLAPRPRVRWLG